MALSLQVTGLSRYFVDRAHTAAEVRRGKPAPDLFLYVADKLGTEPETCLVLEDSEMGVLAAQAAGMETWDFAGGAHIKAGYALPAGLGVDKVVHKMTELHHIFCRTGISHDERVAESPKR